MTERCNKPAIGRRDALGLIAGAVIADLTLATSFPAAALSAEFAAGNAAMPGLATLTARDFEPLVGQTFMVGDNSLTLRKVHRGRNSGPTFRQQFGIVFDAPKRLPFHSETMTMSHPLLGRHDLLATQINNDVGRGEVEICFG